VGKSGFLWGIAHRSVVVNEVLDGVVNISSLDNY